METPSKKWTARQLKAYIRKVTKEINEKYNEYVKNIKHGIGEINEALEREHDRLYRLGKTHPDMTADLGDTSEKNIGVGLSYKKKDELVIQARALDQFNNVDTFTPQYEKDYTEAEKKAYSAFMKNNNYNLDSDNFTLSDYHNLVETLGALGDKINNFGYAEVMNLYVESDTDRRVNFVSAAIAVNDELKGAGYTQERALELLRRKVDL